MAFSSAGEFVVAVEEVKISRKVKEFAIKRIGLGKCLRCECKLYAKGLCSSHYQSTRLLLLRLPLVKRLREAARLMANALYWDRSLLTESDVRIETNPLLDQEAAK